jgi:PAS domain S-box-containing protein
MKPPPIPADEVLRLQALRNYAILDTPPEPDFDAFVQLAAQICGTSMATISLVDAERQWFKARLGVAACETPRDHAFCAHAICQSEQLFVVPDAAQDERFHDSPLVTGEPYLRFYAGAPLITPGGRVLGMLCVLDRVPRQLSVEQASALSVLSRQVMTQLELRRVLGARATDIALRQEAERALLRRDGILEAVSAAAEMLLNAGDYECAMPGALERIGRATDSDHVRVWQHHLAADGASLLSLRHRWHDSALPVVPFESLQNIRWDGANGWATAEELRNNRSVQGGTAGCTPEEQRLLRRFGSESFLCVPIFSRPAQFWGVLTFASARAEVRWSPAEVDALRSAARILGALIYNRAIEEALRLSEERFRALSAAAPIGIFETSSTARENLYSNQRLQAIMGLSEEQIKQGQWQESVHPEDRTKVAAAWERAQHQSGIVAVEHRILRRPGEVRWVRLLASPMKDAQSAVVSFVGTVDDVTDAHLITEALRESENRYRSVVTNLKEVVFQTDAAGLWTFLNPAWSEITGFSVTESLGQLFLAYVHPDDRERNNRLFAPLIERQKAYCRHEVRYLTKDGGFRWIEVFARLTLDEQDRVTGTTGTLNDITARKEAEGQVAASLREKEVLLKEIHHRVKNNMQIVSSLLNLQLDYQPDEKARAMFRELQGRIASMALVHEKLYRSSDLAEIDFADYLRDLTENLLGIMGARARNIAIQLETPELRLGIDTAIPCGLIINELVSNAYKHAFPLGGPGRITIAFARLDDGRLHLTVSDDGCGIPRDLDLRQTKSLGLKLVYTMVQQLHGSLDVSAGPGTRFILHLQEVRRKLPPSV